MHVLLLDRLEETATEKHLSTVQGLKRRLSDALTRAQVQPLLRVYMKLRRPYLPMTVQLRHYTCSSVTLLLHV